MKSLGPKLMQLHVDYDPNSVQISKLNPENGGAESPTGLNPPAESQPNENDQSSPPANQSGGLIRPVWSTGFAWLGMPAISGLLQEAQDSPPQEPQSTKPGEQPAAADERTEAQENAPQETPRAQDQTETAPAETQESQPAQQEPPDANANQPQTPEQPALTADDQFVAKVQLTFAQPISRGSLINLLIAAAERTNQVTLEKPDILLSAPGVELDELSAKSKIWDVTLNIGREGDAKLVLDSLQADYNGQPYFPTISGVGGQIAAQTQWRAVAAIIASLLGLIVYVWVRFQNIAFGFGAVVSLIHDVLVALGAVALSYWLAGILGFAQVETVRISLPIIAAFLTLIGYSINDTIVVFDRIREVRGKRPELTAEMINISVSQTLARTILTTFLTLLAVIVLYLFGGESIHGFAYALLIGMIAGVYSTIFIASPVALWLMNRAMEKRAAQKAANK
jgi:SecD/SecF fusion protein